MNFHAILERPSVYRAAQVLLAPGMSRIVTQRLSRVFEMIPRPERVLDVGCGPASWLWKLGLEPVGLDLCHAYTARYGATGRRAVTASSFELPFPDGFFDVVFSYSLLHHLPVSSAQQTVAEIVRVTRANGHVILFDPVVPKIPALRPVAWALCRLDRGRFIRCQQEYESQILKGAEWKIERFTHSYLGTEGLLSLQVKS